jgi:hypothetical protein
MMVSLVRSNTLVKKFQEVDKEMKLLKANPDQSVNPYIPEDVLE